MSPASILTMKTDKSQQQSPMTLVRAAVSSARSGAGYKLTDRERANLFRNKLRKALLSARSRVAVEKYESFIAQASEVIRVERARFSRQPVDLDELHLLEFSQPMRLEKEIEWIAARLTLGEEAIREHLLVASSIAADVMAGRVKKAIKARDQYVIAHGESFNSISLGIALIQLDQGADGVRPYTNQFKQKNKGGLLPYLAALYAQRSEDGVSIGWFTDYVKRRAKLLAQPGLRQYVEFKLVGETPRTQKGLSYLLAIEQNHHVVDVYETLLAVIQHISVHIKDVSLVGCCNRALSRLETFGDFRVLKLLQKLKGQTALPPTQGVATAQLLSGSASQAYKSYLRHAVEGLSAHNSLVGLAICRSIAKRRTTAQPKRQYFRQRVVDALSSVLERNADERREFHDKTAYTFLALPLGRCLASISRAERALTVEEFSLWLQTAALNTADIGFLDILDVSPAHFPPELNEDSAYAEFSALFQGKSSDATAQLHPIAREYASGFGLLRLSKTLEAEKVLEDLLLSPLRIVARHATVLALLAFAKNQSIGRAAKLISVAVAIDETDPEFLPVEAVFDGIQWKDLQPHAADVSLSNALYLYAQQVTNDKVHSNRCFALQKVLRAFGVDRPSKLKDRPDFASKEELAFFLGKACGTSVLDMLPSIASSREVYEERREICALLVNMGFDESGEYQKELVAISRAIVIQAGLQAFDGSRVHVDTDRLRSVLRRELAESFNRYVQLTQINEGDIETFDSLLRELNRKDAAPKHLLAIPKSEADELLLYMILTARERFLFHIPHGLDSYLSKRVRHGSIVGTMRAPAEKECIATQVGSDGKYKPSDHWMERLEKLQHRKDVASALASFSKALDAYLVRLKDVVLHVKSDSHPLGLFDAPLHGPNYHLIRSVAIRDKSLETFVNTIFSALWGLLNPSLQKARDELRYAFVDFLAKQVEALRANLATIGLAPAVRAEIDSAVGKMSTNLQSTAQSISGWFDPVTPEEHDFYLAETVEIALTAVKSIFPGFDPQLDIDCPEELVISATNLPVVVDVLFVAFQNVAKWAGLSAPAVKVKLWLEEEMLHIEVRNQTVPRDFIALNQALIAKRQALQRNTALKAVRSEGDSGLAKIASVVFQAATGTLAFQYEDASTFCLEMSLSVIPASAEGTK